MERILGGRVSSSIALICYDLGFGNFPAISGVLRCCATAVVRLYSACVQRRAVQVAGVCETANNRLKAEWAGSKVQKYMNTNVGRAAVAALSLVALTTTNAQLAGGQAAAGPAAEAAAGNKQKQVQDQAEYYIYNDVIKD